MKQHDLTTSLLQRCIHKPSWDYHEWIKKKNTYKRHLVGTLKEVRSKNTHILKRFSRQLVSNDFFSVLLSSLISTMSSCIIPESKITIRLVTLCLIWSYINMHLWFYGYEHIFFDYYLDSLLALIYVCSHMHMNINFSKHLGVSQQNSGNLLKLFLNK